MNMSATIESGDARDSGVAPMDEILQRARRVVSMLKERAQQTERDSRT